MSNIDLQKLYINTVSEYTNDSNLIVGLWENILNSYKEKHRFYHTLSHIEALIIELYEVNDKITDWDSVIFSAFYHDVVYDVKANDNEERSAIRAREDLNLLSIPNAVIENCYKQILATKNHSCNEDSDTMYFIDADLAILGYENDIYHEYIKNIRKEYSVYNDKIYQIGRKKILTKISKKNQIFITDYFFEKYEEKARVNIEKELNML